MMEGMKFDNGKLQWNLMPFEALEDTVKVLEFGAKKYDDWTWVKVPDGEKRYYDAAVRHLLAHQKEDADPESGYSHLSHALCCLIFLEDFRKNKEKNA